ncbi:DUF3102 domain-containing protein [Synechococcus sp. BO 8801]|uniref:DUF3102 domain-containing protein n=1 Tax=Synechococcus sp. BO 8801 TaxID=169670 RepID=UPI000B99BBD4|nr:DUF3102 domain-containing protein [Synechococcus sp. BO 8801]
MAKTLNQYSQQIRALAPDALALERARDLGSLLIEAKAAVQAAGRKWGEWLEQDCSLSPRTAQRFMTVAKRWDDPAFAAAREARPDLPLREADKVLAASSSRKRPEPEQADPYSVAMGKLSTALWELELASEIRQVDRWAGAELHAAKEAVCAAKRALMHVYGEELMLACTSDYTPSARRVEMAVGDRCDCRSSHGPISGTITDVHPGASGGWSTYSWLQDGANEPVRVGWGLPGAATGLRHSIAT